MGRECIADRHSYDDDDHDDDRIVAGCINYVRTQVCMQTGCRLYKGCVYTNMYANERMYTSCMHKSLTAGNRLHKYICKRMYLYKVHAHLSHTPRVKCDRKKPRRMRGEKLLPLGPACQISSCSFSESVIFFHMAAAFCSLALAPIGSPLSTISIMIFLTNRWYLVAFP